ncbi:MAG: ribonuclease P protein component [Bacteroidales bacterium]|nr:ribonuclease P protein component [Bacteroidales bacterium]
MEHQQVRKTFTKAERLYEKKLIQQLFKEGSSFFKHPFKVIYLPVKKGDGPRSRVLVSVSKRNFKKAVDRNRIKRLIREAYRHNKHLLSPEYATPKDECLLIGFIYTGKKLPDFQEVEQKIMLILQELVTK